MDKFIEEKKFEDANSLLRFIITSNNIYLPALKKLAAIFKLTDKTNSLIAIYESLIPDLRTETDEAGANRRSQGTDRAFRFPLQPTRSS